MIKKILIFSLILGSGILWYFSQDLYSYYQFYYSNTSLTICNDSDYDIKYFLLKTTMGNKIYTFREIKKNTCTEKRKTWYLTREYSAYIIGEKENQFYNLSKSISCGNFTPVYTSWEHVFRIKNSHPEYLKQNNEWSVYIDREKKGNPVRFF